MNENANVLRLIAGVVLANVILIPGAIVSKEVHGRLVKPAVDAVLDKIFTAN